MDETKTLCFGARLLSSRVHKNNLTEVPLSTDSTSRPPAAVLPSGPRRHKLLHTSVTQSGAMFYSVNLPDGELKRSYNETLNERERSEKLRKQLERAKG